MSTPIKESLRPSSSLTLTITAVLGSVRKSGIVTSTFMATYIDTHGKVTPVFLTIIFATKKLRLAVGTVGVILDVEKIREDTNVTVQRVSIPNIVIGQGDWETKTK